MSTDSRFDSSTRTPTSSLSKLGAICETLSLRCRDMSLKPSALISSNRSLHRTVPKLLRQKLPSGLSSRARRPISIDLLVFSSVPVGIDSRGGVNWKSSFSSARSSLDNEELSCCSSGTSSMLLLLLTKLGSCPSS